MSTYFKYKKIISWSRKLVHIENLLALKSEKSRCEQELAEVSPGQKEKKIEYLNLSLESILLEREINKKQKGSTGLEHSF